MGEGVRVASSCCSGCLSLFAGTLCSVKVMGASCQLGQPCRHSLRIRTYAAGLPPPHVQGGLLHHRLLACADF